MTSSVADRSAPPRLIITADDSGYAPGYDAGIVEAAHADAIDAVSVMVLRDPDPDPILVTGVELGLHLELTQTPGVRPPGGRVASGERSASAKAIRDQLARFEAMFAAMPAYLDGHRHCHAAPEHGVAIAREAAALGLAVRSVNEPHRRILRSAGVQTPDRLIGRLHEDEDPLPFEIEAWVERGEAPSGVTEWFVHPGHSDPGSGSSYDLGRAEDLVLLLRLAVEPRLRAARSTYAAAWASSSIGVRSSP